MWQVQTALLRPNPPTPKAGRQAGAAGRRSRQAGRQAGRRSRQAQQTGRQAGRQAGAAGRRSRQAGAAGRRSRQAKWQARTSALKMTREPTGPPSSSSRLKSGPAVTTRCEARMYAKCASLHAGQAIHRSIGRWFVWGRQGMVKQTHWSVGHSRCASLHARQAIHPSMGGEGNALASQPTNQSTDRPTDRPSSHDRLGHRFSNPYTYRVFLRRGRPPSLSSATTAHWMRGAHSRSSSARGRQRKPCRDWYTPSFWCWGFVRIRGSEHGRQPGGRLTGRHPRHACINVCTHACQHQQRRSNQTEMHMPTPSRRPSTDLVRVQVDEGLDERG